MWRKSILRELMNIMEVKRKSIHSFKKASKNTKYPHWREVFNRLAEYETNRAELIEIVYDNLAQNNEWLSLQYLFDEGPKPIDVEQLFQEIQIDEIPPEHNTLDNAIKAGEEVLKLYEEIISECEKRLHNGETPIKWLRDQAKEYNLLLKTIRKGEHATFKTDYLG
ncbi:MAG: hypothetical protein KKD39_03705 [Candidatus Altiarchaeota archaeon]|nr:hypothetical protein [Candidatus Altiarchaeota archaeon]